MKKCFHRRFLSSSITKTSLLLPLVSHSDKSDRLLHNVPEYVKFAIKKHDKDWLDIKGVDSPGLFYARNLLWLKDAALVALVAFVKGNALRDVFQSEEGQEIKHTWYSAYEQAAKEMEKRTASHEDDTFFVPFFLKFYEDRKEVDVWSLFSTLRRFRLIDIGRFFGILKFDDSSFLDALWPVFHAIVNSDASTLHNKPISEEAIKQLEAHWSQVDKPKFKLLSTRCLRMGCSDLKRSGSSQEWTTFIDVCFIYMERRPVQVGEKYSHEFKLDLKDVNSLLSWGSPEAFSFEDLYDSKSYWQICSTTWRFETQGDESGWKLAEILETLPCHGIDTENPPQD
jgi:hypothetical protein